ncbi:hypothetical protein [Streptomyces achromogenes]|uniref:hypothetical protein n=1 Tax=Streptomyces achromogenes TaxID=67255 RepID=UPI00343C8F7F
MPSWSLAATASSLGRVCSTVSTPVSCPRKSTAASCSRRRPPFRPVRSGSSAAADRIPAAHPEVDWEHLRTTEKGRHSPLAALAKQAAPA